MRCIGTKSRGNRSRFGHNSTICAFGNCFGSIGKFGFLSFYRAFFSGDKKLYYFYFSIKLDWREASLYATYLVENSKWSRTIYTYQKAVILMMLGDQLTSSEQKTIESLLR